MKQRIEGRKAALVLGGAAAAFGAYYAFLRPKHLHWGATKEEFDQYLPGDELVPKAIHNATHAMTIAAPPEYVWPWLVQLGQDKGGFYSYTVLENMLGCHMRNTDQLHPEWQQLKAGDEVTFHPKTPKVQVLILEENRHMVLGEVGKYLWAFHLKALPDGQTRMVVRALSGSKGAIERSVEILFWEPAHFVMERKMMLTVKRLAESWFREAQH